MTALLQEQKRERKDEKQNEKAKPLKPIQDVATRWNSTYLMINRLVKLKPFIGTVLVNSEHSSLLLSASQWDLVIEMIKALKPVFEATKIVSAEKYCHPFSLTFLGTQRSRTFIRSFSIFTAKWKRSRQTPHIQK